MVRIELPAAQYARAFFDANALIYFLEGPVLLQDKVAALLSRFIKDGVELVINEIVVAECLYGAYRQKNAKAEASIRAFLFASGQFEILGIDMTLLDEAAKAGALVGLKLIDATHLCSAISSGCDVFVTNDQKFKSSPALQVIQINTL